MTIKEIEAYTGMERANIRFYEREGLLAPGRLANGYRDYTEADADTLLRIKLLRNLHVPLEEIRAMQAGERSLESAMREQIRALENEKNHAAAAQAVCRSMQSDGAQFESLDADKYLRQLSEGGEERPNLTMAHDTAPEPAYPWRRYFARTLDLMLYTLPFEFFCLITLHANPNSAEWRIVSIFSAIFGLLVMLLLEPLLLRLFRTTPGKALFGLKLENGDGTPLSYRTGRTRTWKVILWGLGLQIPGFSLYRLWKSRKRCIDGEAQPWDDYPYPTYTIKDTKPWRGWVFVAAHVVLFFLTALATDLSAMPPNRGDLTVAQFAENYNFLADYYGDEPAYLLSETGEWVEAPLPEGTYVISFGSGRTPLEYTTENGVLTGITISAEDRDIFDTFFFDPSITVLAFVRAQPGAGVFSGAADKVAKQTSTGNDYAFDLYGVSVRYDVELSEDSNSADFTFELKKE